MNLEVVSGILGDLWSAPLTEFWEEEVCFLCLAFKTLRSMSRLLLNVQTRNPKPYKEASLTPTLSLIWRRAICIYIYIYIYKTGVFPVVMLKVIVNVERLWARNPFRIQSGREILWNTEAGPNILRPVRSSKHRLIDLWPWSGWGSCGCDRLVGSRAKE